MNDASAALIVRPESPPMTTTRFATWSQLRSSQTSRLSSSIASRASPEYMPDMGLVAELDGRIVGHVMISRALLRHDRGERQISMLSPLAVLPEHQGAGIGSALVRASLEVAEALGEPLVILEGSPPYYGRLGFEHSVRYGIEIQLPEWAPREAAQVTRLTSFDPDDPTLRGTVVYPAAFDGLD